MLADFSFTNTQIKAYFEGSDSYIPSSELLYIHSHPLVRPNFLDQLEAMINSSIAEIERRSIRGAIIDKFTDFSIKLGAELADLNQDNAPIALQHLREIYKLCKHLLESD